MLFRSILCLLLEVFSHIFLRNSRYVLSTVYDVPSIDKLNGDDYKDLKADVKILTGETPQNKFSSARRRREAMRWHR